MSRLLRAPVLLYISLSIVLFSGGAAAAADGPSTVPKVVKLSGNKARVAQGVKIDLAASELTAAQLAALRPDYANLKPRARSNAE